jgi:YVTN family beta-propeller protein
MVLTTESRRTVPSEPLSPAPLTAAWTVKLLSWILLVVVLPLGAASGVPGSQAPPHVPSVTWVAPEAAMGWGHPVIATSTSGPAVPARAAPSGSAPDGRIARSSIGAPAETLTTARLEATVPDGGPFIQSGWLAYDAADDGFWVAVAPSSVDLFLSNATTTINATVPVGLDPFGVAADPATHSVFVANTGSDNVTEISDLTDLPTNSFAVGGAPEGIAVDAVAGEVFVANSGSDNVTVFNESQQRVVANIPVGAAPIGVVADPSTGQVFVTDKDSYAVTAINVSTEVVVATIPVGIDPYGIALDNATDNLYVANTGSDNVSVLHAATDQLVATIAAANAPYTFSMNLEGVAYDSSTGQVWIGAGQFYAVLLNSSTETVSAYLSGDPSGVAWDAADQMMCVTNSFNATFECFSPTTHSRAQWDENTVTVHEVGLPNGTTWKVDRVNGPSWSSSSSQQQLNLDTNYATIGFTLSLVIPPVGGYTAIPSEINWSLPGSSSSPKVWNVSFAQRVPVYQVQVDASGLPAGVGWDVALNGELQSARSAAMNFSLPNGSYSYQVGSIDNYSGAPSNGTLHLSGSSAVLSVTFSSTAPTYAMNFTEQGLPGGDLWFVNSTSGPAGAILPDSGPIAAATTSLDFANGSYVVTVQSNAGYVATPTIHFTQYGGALVPPGIPRINFSLPSYPVFFRSQGLPNGTTWGVALNGVLQNGTGAQLEFTEPSGSYLYNVSAPPGYRAIPQAGIVSVSATSSPVVILNFTSTALYPLDFRETGLPPGTGWGVAIGSQLSSSTTADVNLSEPNGTFSYVILDVAGFTTTYSGRVQVRGSNQTIPITFQRQTYPVVIVESGLPAGTNWSVTIVDQAQGFNETLTTNGSALLFYLPNGTYQITVSLPPGYTATVSPSSFTVAGMVAVPPVVGYSPKGSISPPPIPSHATSTPSPFSSPWALPLGGIAIAALVLGLAWIVLTRRGRSPEGPFVGPSGPLPPDPSNRPAPPVSPRARDGNRPEGDRTPEPLDDAF